MNSGIRELLYTTQKARPYNVVLSEIQEYLSNTYQDVFVSDLEGESESRLIKRYIEQYLTTHHVRCTDEDDLDALIERLYLDMVGFSFITEWLKNADEMDLEEIDINSWDDIELIMQGSRRKAKERFLSPQHALDVIRRMLQVSDAIIDDAKPAAAGSLAKNIRITVLKTPLLDGEVGISASIRIIRSKMLSRERLTRTTATSQMLDFLALAVRYGSSVCVAGNTGSGKTSTVGWLLSTVPDSKRIFTIEEGSREFDLVRRDENGRVVSSVVHTLTRPSMDVDSHIDQEALLDYSLRFNPDIICVGEMRSKEAFAAQEAARTGHTVVTTIHSKSAVGAYMRMTTLAKRAHEFSDDTLLRLMVEAFPIIVYQRQMEDSSRKMVEIVEGESSDGGRVVHRTLFRYVVDDNRMVDGRPMVTGHYEQVSRISDSLRQELLQNGAPIGEVEQF